MVYSSKKPYQRESKSSSRFLKEGIGPESVFEKPYLQGEYGEMNQAPNVPTIPPNVGGFGGLRCLYSRSECEINAECYAGPDIKIDGGPEEASAGYTNPVAVAGVLANWSIGADPRQITLVLDPNQTRNIIEVNFIDGWGETYTELVDANCARPPGVLLVVNFTDIYASLNYSLDVILYDPVEEYLIAGPDERMYRSADIGVNWTYEASLLGYPRYGVYDVANATLSITSAQRNMYVSSDGGDTWTHEVKLAGISSSDEVDAMLYDPVNETIVAFIELSGSTGIEAWQSTDGGYNWVLKDTLADAYGVIDVTYDSVNSTVVLLTGHSSGTSYACEIWVSDDGGDTWALKKDLKTDYSIDFVSAIAYDSTRSRLIITCKKATGNSLIWASTDGGTNWSELLDLGYVFTSDELTYNPVADKLYSTRLTATKTQILSSATGGANWTVHHEFDYPLEYIDSLTYIPALDTTFIGISQNNWILKLWSIIE